MFPYVFCILVFSPFFSAFFQYLFLFSISVYVIVYRPSFARYDSVKSYMSYKHLSSAGYEVDSIHEASDPVDAVRKAEGIFIGEEHPRKAATLGISSGISHFFSHSYSTLLSNFYFTRYGV